MPRELRRALVHVLRTIAELTKRIVGFESRIEQSGKSRHPETQRLRQVDGVGPITSSKDSDLRRFRLALASPGRKSAKKRAVIPVARKLAVLLHRLWITGRDYDPLQEAEGRNPQRRRRA